MPEAAEWIARLLTGTSATIIATIAVAVIGLLLMLGEVSITRTARVILGCFIVFGSGVIAAGLADLTSSSSDYASAPVAASQPPAEFVSPAVDPSGYDPYAGAAVPDNRSAEEGWLER